MSPPAQTSAPVDLAHLHDLTGGEPTLTREIASLYVSTATACLAEIEQARATGADVSRLAHSLKGSSLNLGAGEMARLAAAVERGQLDPGQLAAMRAELGRVARFMKLPPRARAPSPRP